MDTSFAKRILYGLILIASGCLFLGSQFGYITLDPGEIASTYWPVLLIFFGLSGLLGQIRNRRDWGGSYMWNLFVITLGAGFLAKNLGYLDLSLGDFFKLLVPVFIILLGIRMMFQSKRPIEPKRDYRYKYEYTPNQGDVHDSEEHNRENRSGFFGDLYLGHDYWTLKPMNISHFIGDTIIDLTKAQIPVGETKLNISAFIGDIKVFVPNDMDVGLSVVSNSFLRDSTIFNKRESGFSRSMKEETLDFGQADKKIRLQVSLFIGDITVQRVG